jgi:hypothetical protein
MWNLPRLSAAVVLFKRTTAVKLHSAERIDYNYSAERPAMWTIDQTACCTSYSVYKQHLIADLRYDAPTRDTLRPTLLTDDKDVPY